MVTSLGESSTGEAGGFIVDGPQIKSEGYHKKGDGGYVARVTSRKTTAADGDDVMEASMMKHRLLLQSDDDGRRKRSDSVQYKSCRAAARCWETGRIYVGNQLSVAWRRGPDGYATGLWSKRFEFYPDLLTIGPNSSCC